LAEGVEGQAEVSVPLSCESPARVLVLRALELGDLLCSVPAFRSIRAAYPDAEITLLGLPWAESFVARFHAYLDRFLPFQGYPGLPEHPFDARRTTAFLKSLREERYDLAIQMHGSGLIVNPLISMLGARRIAGFFEPGQYCPDDQTFFPYPDSGPEIRRWLHLTEKLGMPSHGEELEFPLTQEDWDGFAGFTRSVGLNEEPYVCLHPGARSPDRRWAADKFARVGDALAAAGLRVFITGSDVEIEIAENVARQMERRGEVVAGKSDLGAIACLLAQATAYVGNDTGVAHIATALKTPGVLIFTGSDPKRWAPLTGRLSARIDAGAASPDSAQREPLRPEDVVADVLKCIEVAA
jgi:ADP-heptose:LPS heptosyltransferase